MLNIENLVIERDGKPLCYHQAIPQGDLVTIQGRSGVGKSTLLLAIAGFVETKQGDIQWDGISLLPFPAMKRPISMLFQENNLFEHLSVQENLRLGLSKHYPQTNIEHAAEQLEVAPYLTKQPNELSGGQRQRIALLRTLIRPEPIVLLDEPFAELDSHTRQLASSWVREQAKAQGKTLLLVTHQAEDVEQVADWNWVM